MAVQVASLLSRAVAEMLADVASQAMDKLLRLAPLLRLLLSLEASLAFGEFLCGHSLIGSALRYVAAFGGRLAAAHKRLSKACKQSGSLVGGSREPDSVVVSETACRRPAANRPDAAGTARRDRPSPTTDHPTEFTRHVRPHQELRGTGSPVATAA